MLIRNSHPGPAARVLSLGIILAGLCAESCAAAIVGIYGAGSTTGEMLHRELMNCYGNTSGGQLAVGLVTPSATCFGATPYRSGVELLYVGVGSAFGKLGFVNGDPNLFTNGTRIPDKPPVAGSTDLGSFYGTGTGAGWTPAANGTSFPKISFSTSTLALSSQELATYNAHAAPGGWGPAIQVPAFVAPIAVVFHPTAGWTENGQVPVYTSETQLGSLVDLSTGTWCGIFTGAIVNWNDPQITADNGGVMLGSGPISVVYANGVSGPTALFSNALVAQCSHTSHPVPQSWQTAPGNVASAGSGQFFANVKTAGLLPASFVAATGSAGVKALVNATVGAIGYVTPDFSLPLDATGPETANLQIYATLATAPQFIAPAPKNATATMAKAKVPSFLPTCAVLKQGCASNPSAWGVADPAPKAVNAYPIGGFSFVSLYSCYHSATDSDAMLGTTVGNLGYFRWYFGLAKDNAGSVRATLWAHGFGLPPNAWMTAVKKLLFTNPPTMPGVPGQLGTVCASVVGPGA
jgi:ABC-type phosphate transport system substrate-binding protein